jgi:hypothetical protein
MEMLMLTVAWGNQEEHTVYCVQVMPAGLCNETYILCTDQPSDNYGETVTCIIPAKVHHVHTSQ